MRLRSLTLHGFKSFATRIQIDFEPGVTAIVGPNGSGKSNVADAFRWVLGEQSLRALRGKRTEDVIFAGGAARAPAGMAEATLLVDDLDPRLELPFAELALVRRAYRSGENEFYLNRERTRLRDVLDLVGRLGLGAQGLTVVGQGAVDAALSLRAEDRRALLEHAAAVGHLQARLADASERLAQTEANLSRVSDLIAEVGPRLRALERQARQVREGDRLRAELERALVRWYAHLLAAPARQAREAAEDAELRRAELAALEGRRATLTAEIGRTDGALVAAEAELGEGERALAAVTERLAARRGELALARERRGQAALRIADLAQRASGAEQELAEAASALQQHANERAEMVGRLAPLEAALAGEEDQAVEDERRRHALEAALAEARAAATRAGAELASLEGRRHAAADRLRDAAARRQERAEEVEATSRRVEDARRALGAAEFTREAARRAVESATANRRAAAEQLDAARRAGAEHDARAAEAERELRAAEGRVDSLEAREESGSRLYPGVRAILRAANGHGEFHLDGIVGVAGRLLATRREHELAVETALGGHAQDVVVERWRDAEAAISELKRRGAGRATFLPLDTLRPPRPPPAPAGPGVVGVASALVEVEDRFRGVATLLLGHTLIVQDLRTARQLLAGSPSSFQIVTLDGEVVRSSGVVTGGSSEVAKGGMLANARELREARASLARAAADRDRRAAEAAAARAAVDQARARADDAGRCHRAAEDELRRAAAQVADAERELERARRDADGLQSELKRLVAAETAARGALDDLGAAERRARAAWTSAEGAPSRAQEALAAFEASSADRRARFAALRAEREQIARGLAALDAEVRRVERRRARARDEAAAAREGRCRAEAEARDLEGRIASLERCQGELAAREVDLGRELESRRSTSQSTRALRSRLHDERRDLDEAQAGAARALQAAEARAERARVEIDALARETRRELGDVAAESIAAGLLRVRRDGIIAEAPIEPADDADRLQARIEGMRARLRTLPSGPDLLAEYDATRERHAFLTDQSDDLGRTAATLRATIEETRRTMRERFGATFDVANEAFARRFTALFGGGTARLVLDGDDSEAGIEVIAQPPGKRSQNLATLSGGERALAAAALLFALVEVNPPPFCVLDEVDASLDESNVGRFAAMLAELSRRTQIVVITHNRRTMEAASAIYGLTLENRSESRIISLRLPSSGGAGREDPGSGI